MKRNSSGARVRHGSPALLLAAALALSACGGGSGGSKPQQPPQGGGGDTPQPSSNWDSLKWDQDDWA